MNPTLKIALVVTAGALLLLFSAYINGFPIVYSDTSTFLASGFELDAPFDRPITYGLFLRFASLNGLSLWLVIFAQTLILSFLIFNLIKICLPKRSNINGLFFIIIAFFSILTSVSWTTSQLISDVFTPIMLLALLIVVIGHSNKRTQLVLYFIFFLATAMHMSHVTFNIVLIGLILMIRQIKFLGIKKAIQLKPLLICFSLSLMSIFTMGSALSKSKHGFLMGALVEHGIAKQYLDEHCDNKDYEFCVYKDSLPDKAWKFLWKDDSPFYKMGSWKGTKREFNEIISNTLTTPKYLELHVKESVKATGDQLMKFGIGDGNGDFLEGTMLYERVGKYFPHELDPYASSLQNTKNLTFLNWYNRLLYFIVLLSIVGLFVVLTQVARLDKKVLSIILVVILAVAINAWACGTFANAIDRLGSKMIWLIPLIVIFGGIHIWDKTQLPLGTKRGGLDDMRSPR